MEVLVQPNYCISVREINKYINRRFNRVLPVHQKTFVNLTRYRFARENCQKMAKPFSDFMKCYMQYTSRDDFRTGGKVLLRRYDLFILEFTHQLIRDDRSFSSKTTQKIWLEITANLQREAKKNSNFPLYWMVDQIRTDLYFYIEFYAAK
jgi:hypothetical protein